MLEAEKGKFCAEAEKKVLEEKVWEIGKKLSATDDKLREVYDKLREAEMHKQLLEKEAQSYRNDVKETQQKMEEENMRLSTNLAELHLQEEAARERVQETERERATLELRVASLQAEVESGRKEREEEVASHERQLSDARRQQQMVEEELKVVWKEMGKKQERYMGWEVLGHIHACLCLSVTKSYLTEILIVTKFLVHNVCMHVCIHSEYICWLGTLPIHM